MEKAGPSVASIEPNHLQREISTGLLHNKSDHHTQPSDLVMVDFTTQLGLPVQVITEEKIITKGLVGQEESEGHLLPLIAHSLESQPSSSTKRTRKRSSKSEGRLQRKANASTLTILATAKRGREDQSSGGGLLLLWGNKVQIITMYCSYFFIVVNFIPSSGTNACWSVFVYVSASKLERELQWETLLCEVVFNGDFNGHNWFISGDGKDLLLSSNKKGGTARSEGSLSGFRTFVANMECR
ncbi:non-LTR retroelement reverse transcriptase-like protein, partial [Striga asiatica]